MIVYLMYQEIKVARLNMYVSLSGVHVLQTDILQAELLPEEMREYPNTILTNPALLMDYWLQQRAIPNSRDNFEQTMIQLFQLKHPTWGRLYGLQHSAALLCHYMSMQDDYWINPTRTEAVSHVYEEPRFDRLYLFPQSDYEHLLHLRENPDTDTGRILAGEKLEIWNFDGLDLTIPSKIPCRWSKVDGRIVLVGKDGEELQH